MGIEKPRGFMSADGVGIVSFAAGLLMAALLASQSALGDLAKDREECAAQLVGLATCLAYVQGEAAVPTPDCCSGLKGVLARSPKCLCVLVKDRDDPSLGLKINLTRALYLPTSCGAAANISRCPELLNLPPNSPDAQVFKNLTTGSNAKANAASNEEGGRSGVNGISASDRLHSWIAAGGEAWPGLQLLFSVLLLVAAFAAG
ncbi:hypothetical protein HPP92_009371 [Vanilla planifolia]|uniref:Bifunctional inhibitor/plant lipid transfer protein/seed storage helical domain-containing protein n=1 Tax=Vanilla planifolia TaxID=51239 RepID=A0A835RDR6_VANPL|nr:hypothetical protein HPP92_009371 [Vanilla planifolia]